ncbi:glycerol channel [Entomophthora muscae]|uniref:Glycerol channel n=1 Tax=Entomophthora muscae TaxID=34485 RepID=A0ACC2UPN9_9FUNG|nr:glycerol channel [Entomophthora muscae]
MSHKPAAQQDYRFDEAVSQNSSRKRLRALFSEFFAEVLGTFVFVTFGSGAVMQTHLYGEADVLVSKVIVALAIGMGLAMGICIAGQISGGHVNPTVTVSLAVFRGFPWRKVPVYFMAQTIGSLVSAAAVALFNAPAISLLEPSSRMPLFASTSPPENTYMITFANIGFGTAFLMIGVMSLSDPRNKCPSWFFPFGILVLQFLICLILPGYPLNPAWDFGYRLFSMPISFSSEFDFSYFLIPMTAPIIGGLFGCGIYDLLLPIIE